MIRMVRTVLRHRMLHACSVGRVRCAADGTGRDWNIKSGVSTYAQMARAVNWLLDQGLVRMDAPEVIPTERGANVLYEWDSRYGAVTARA